MANFRILLGAALIIAAFAFALKPASARFCEHRDDVCEEADAGAPLSLLDFLKQIGAAKSDQNAPKKPAVAKSNPETAPAVEPQKAAVDDGANVIAASEPETFPVRTIESNGIAVTSAEDWNEIDAQADRVKVVGAGELNEIDLAADTRATVRAYEPEALQSMASADAPMEDRAWIGQLLAAVGATFAVVAAARLLSA